MLISVVLLGALAPRAQGEELRQDTFLCEDAVSRLGHCCPGFDPATFQCNYDPGDGCANRPASYPEIDISTARCLLASTCSDIAAFKCGVVLPCR